MWSEIPPWIVIQFCQRRLAISEALYPALNERRIIARLPNLDKQRRIEKDFFWGFATDPDEKAA